jgi:DNA-binding Lrp family transcriptional regulator
MITAIVQIRCSRDLIPQTAEAVAELPGIAEVYSVSGDYDLMAVLKVKDYDAIAQVVTEQMTRVPGIVRTNTISAFRVYSRADREAGFTLGAG